MRTKEFTVLDRKIADKDSIESYKIVKSRIDHTALLWVDKDVEKIIVYGGQDHSQIKLSDEP